MYINFDSDTYIFIEFFPVFLEIVKDRIQDLIGKVVLETELIVLPLGHEPKTIRILKVGRGHCDIDWESYPSWWPWWHSRRTFLGKEVVDPFPPTESAKGALPKSIEILIMRSFASTGPFSDIESNSRAAFQAREGKGSYVSLHQHIVPISSD